MRVEIGRHIGRCIRGEEDDARDIVTEEARSKGERRARIDAPRHSGGNRKCHIGQGIVKEHLQGVHDERILHEVYHAVDEAREAANARSIPIGEEEQGHHRPECHAAALRHVEKAQLMEYDGQREHERDIDEHVRREADAAHLQIAEDEDEYGEQREEAGRLRRKFRRAIDECIHENLLGLCVVYLESTLAYYKMPSASIPSATSVSLS